MIGNKYDTIVKCTLVSIYDTYTEQYLLTHDNCDSEFEVDLKGDFYFNCSYDCVDRTFVKKVNSLEELKAFCKEHDINIRKDCLEGNDTLYIGGCRDYKLDNNLVVVDFIGEKC